MFEQHIRSTALSFALAVASSGAFSAGSHATGHGDGISAIGAPGKSAQVTRTFNVDMTDNMRYTPAEIAVKQGETIRIVVKNSGRLRHELVLGTPQDLKKHYDMMLKMPGMEHADANMVSVAPDETGEVIWHFTQSGKVDFACLQPGHYDAGMKGLLKVAGDKEPSKNSHGNHKD